MANVISAIVLVILLAVGVSVIVGFILGIGALFATPFIFLSEISEEIEAWRKKKR